MTSRVVQLFLERTSPHMLPAASSIFFTLDKRMDGEIRYKVRHSIVLIVKAQRRFGSLQSQHQYVVLQDQSRKLSGDAAVNPVNFKATVRST